MRGLPFAAAVGRVVVGEVIEYVKEQIEELKGYCLRVSALAEGNDTYLHLEKLRLPEGCEPRECDALLRPFGGPDGYPSRLYFSVQIRSSYARNWNISNTRICEKNWFAFSWMVTLPSPTLPQILVAHLTGFTKEK